MSGFSETVKTIEKIIVQMVGKMSGIGGHRIYPRTTQEQEISSKPNKI